MKPTIEELKQLRRDDERLYRFKESNFEAHGYDAHPTTLVWLGLFLIPVIGQLLLLSVFLLEWYLKFLRMTLIFLTQIKLMIMRFNYGKLLLVIGFIIVVLFILSNIFK